MRGSLVLSRGCAGLFPDAPGRDGSPGWKERRRERGILRFGESVSGVGFGPEKRLTGRRSLCFCEYPSVIRSLQMQAFFILIQCEKQR